MKNQKSKTDQTTIPKSNPIRGQIILWGNRRRNRRWKNRGNLERRKDRTTYDWRLTTYDCEIGKCISCELRVNLRARIRNQARNCWTVRYAFWIGVALKRKYPTGRPAGYYTQKKERATKVRTFQWIHHHFTKESKGTNYNFCKKRFKRCNARSQQASWGKIRTYSNANFVFY